MREGGYLLSPPLSEGFKNESIAQGWFLSALGAFFASIAVKKPSSAGLSVSKNFNRRERKDHAKCAKG